MARITITEFKRDPNSVFVSVQPPESVQQAKQATHYYRDWTAAASGIASDTPNPEPTPQASVEVSHPDIPSADELLEAHLPQHIEASRWGRYIVPNPASRILNGTIFVSHNPCDNFWDLYNLSKGIFRVLGIKLSKVKGAWEANIPIAILTDKVFVDSGLASVEKTLMSGTGIDPGRISSEIRNRQFAETKRGMAKVKQMREGLADAAGVLVITAVSWFAYIMMGVC